MVDEPTTKVMLEVLLIFSMPILVGSFAVLPGRLFAQTSIHIARAHAIVSSEYSNDPFNTVEVTFGKETYEVSVQPGTGTSSRPKPPPLVLIPPVGVGIDRKFYDRVQREWAALGAPAAMHSIDLLGTGSSTPKPRRFYSPQVWADQLDGYIRDELKEPCVLVVQGGLLPSALEVWRRSGSKAIAGVSVLSPPPLRFFTRAEDAADGAAAMPAGQPTPGDAGFNPPTAAPRMRKRDVLRRALLFWRRVRSALSDDDSKSHRDEGERVSAGQQLLSDRRILAVRGSHQRGHALARLVAAPRRFAVAGADV